MATIANNVFSIQSYLGHRCAEVEPPAGGFVNLGHMAEVQRQAHEAWLEWKKENVGPGLGWAHQYGIPYWETEGGITAHKTASFRLQIEADEAEGTITVSCWAGPSGSRPAMVAAEATYEQTDEAYRALMRTDAQFVVVDEYVDDELVEEKPERAFFLVELDRQVFGGALRRRTACPGLLSLFREREAVDNRRSAIVELSLEFARRAAAGEFEGGENAPLSPSGEEEQKIWRNVCQMASLGEVEPSWGWGQDGYVLAVAHAATPVAVAAANAAVGAWRAKFG